MLASALPMRRFATRVVRGSAACYYRVLGVKETDSLEAIKTAYFSLAKRHHPDTNAAEDKDASALNFQKISEAYQFLSDSVKREAYDKDDDMHSNHNGGDGGGGQTLDDLISQVRRHISRQHQSAMYPTPPIKIGLDLPLARLFEKSQPVEIKYASYVMCTECRGAGTTVYACSDCARGKPACDCHRKCQACNGEGRVWAKQRSTWVNIPLGIRSGEVLVVKTVGHWTKSGGVGDLHVNVQIHSPPESNYARCERSRYDLRALIPVSLADSLLGCKREFKLYGDDGSSPVLMLDIPPFCANGYELRLMGRGLAKTMRNKGDLICTINVQLPSAAELSPKQVELLRAFQAEEEKIKH